MNYHPLWDSFVVVLLTTLVVGLTPASSSLRPACLPILCALVWHCLLKCPEYIARSSWASSVGGYTLSSLLQYIDVAVLSRWSFELQGPENDLIKGTTHIAPSKAPTRPQAKTSHGFEIIDRFKFGLWVFCSWRFVNTPFQVRNILRLDDSLSQSRLRFLLHMGVTIIVCYLILDVMGSSSDSDIADKFYSSDKIGLLCRIQEVSLEELVMRFFAALALGASLVSVQRGVYCILAFISVAMGLHSPADWPPFNGPLSAISNLRSFWSIFWHQINTHRLFVLSDYLLYDVLRLKRGTKAARYIRPWTIFFLSGLMHVGIDLSSGIPIHESGALRFFCIQPLGIIIEDVVLSVYQSVTSRPTTYPSTVAEHLLGCFWVGLWMSWTAPGYLYPILAKGGSGQDGVVPVSIIGYVKGVLS